MRDGWLIAFTCLFDVISIDGSTASICFDSLAQLETIKQLNTLRIFASSGHLCMQISVKWKMVRRQMSRSTRFTNSIIIVEDWNSRALEGGGKNWAHDTDIHIPWKTNFLQLLKKHTVNPFSLCLSSSYTNISRPSTHLTHIIYSTLSKPSFCPMATSRKNDRKACIRKAYIYAAAEHLINRINKPSTHANTRDKESN